ncbi:MAG TPA: Rap1a/Tai family immunity protein [Xanthomonadales bacterium]|nr:Rap1a/Tai family immunity protein [Xanthomonadales bacterium]
MRQLAEAAKRLILISGMVMPGIFSITAQADWLTEPELRESCEAFATLPYSLEGSSCLAFVQGFLLGSNRIVVVEDGSIETRSEPNKETFVERAVRTRLGNSHIERINDASEVKYCIDESTNVADLVQAISDYLSSSTHTTGMTDPKALQLALAERFPCND